MSCNIINDFTITKMMVGHGGSYYSLLFSHRFTQMNADRFKYKEITDSILIYVRRTGRVDESTV